jgi:hypothetical protein
MSAVLLAIFNEYKVAERARVERKLEFLSNTTVGVLDAGIRNSGLYPNRRSDEH